MSISRKKPNAIELVNYKDSGYTNYVKLIDNRLVDNSGNELNVDAISRTLSIIDIHASKLHCGDSFYMKGYIELDNTDTFYIKLTTPATKEMHFTFTIKSTGVLETTFDEAATGGMTGGTVVTPLNRNRNSTTTSGAVLTKGVTAATSYVTRLSSDKWGSSGFRTSIGGAGATIAEYILRKSTTYIRSFISGSDNNIVQFEASWTESTNLS